jgi:nifR3 family TIM-barrel protein
MNFWQSLDKPIFALAPMEDVTDTVFREVVLSVSDPKALNVVFTEFTSTEGMCHEHGRLKVMERLQVNESEKLLLRSGNTKLVAQIWGSDPGKFAISAKMISEMDIFDGIDINMGCPVKKILKNKSCSALINHPELARDIISATIEATELPVSVKTRLGFKTIITEEWIGNLLEANPAAIIIHGRTQKMMSYGPVLWDEIGKAARLRDSLGSNVKIIGNGDIKSYSEGISRVEQYGIEGVMVGTGVFQNPWLFNSAQVQAGLEERIALMLKHIQLFESSWGKQKNFNILKRFFKIYLSGFRGAVEWRDKFMHATDYSGALQLVNELLKEINSLEPFVQAL